VKESLIFLHSYLRKKNCKSIFDQAGKSSLRAIGCTSVDYIYIRFLVWRVDLCVIHGFTLHIRYKV